MNNENNNDNISNTDILEQLKQRGVKRHTCDAVRRQMWEAMQENRLERLLIHLDCKSSPHLQLARAMWMTEEEKGKFFIVVKLDDRKAWKLWLEERGFDTEPIEKLCEVGDDDKPVTAIIREVRFQWDGRDVELNVSYDRPGLPSAKCYVSEQTSSYKTCVCSLD